MRKLIIWTLVLIGIYIFLRVTGGLQWHKLQNMDDEPNIHTQSWILASNLIKPRRWDFVCFQEEKNYLRALRVCGLPGDTVEIKDALLYVNGITRDRHIGSAVPPGKIDSLIYLKFGHLWNKDQFGPIVVPAGSYFLLGDNREECKDSRYSGFIPRAICTGTVLWHS